MMITKFLHFNLVLVFLWLPYQFANSNPSLVNIGLILDLNSSIGIMTKSCVNMAISDFYKLNPDYRTKLVIHPKNADGIIDEASAALELLKNEEVVAINLGPQGSTEAKFIAELGEKAHVPIISFSSTSSSTWDNRNRYFIHSTVADYPQVEAIIAIVQNFKWHQVILLYEDSDYGNGLIPHLNDAFQEAEIQLPYMRAISPSAQDYQIRSEFDRMKKMQTTVFLVHMTPALGSRLFLLAKTEGMMREGSAWIITDGLSNSLNILNSTVMEAMEGVLGIRPYVPKYSKELENFKSRWGQNFQLTETNSTSTYEPNIYCFWAYDSVRALAAAVERIGPINSSFVKKKNSNENASEIANLGISEVGPRLLDEILKTNYKGLSGDFSLEHGELKASGFEIFNILGKERTIGYWTKERGITQEIDERGTTKKLLKKIIWPGDSTDAPRGWAIPAIGEKLKVGVPLRVGFTQFVKVENDSKREGIIVTGFCKDVFQAVLDVLPYHIDPDYISFEVSNNDDTVKLLENKTLDVVVGDITIVSYRALAVDFTLPYTESGVVMVVPAKNDKLRGMWVFVEPFKLDLWLTIGLAFIFIGLVLWILERYVNPQQQLGMLFWFPLSALAFPERKMVSSKWARFVLVIWLFMAFILLQSYTASLSSILTVEKLKPSSHKRSRIGYQDGSFVKNLLTKKLNKTDIRSYSTVEEYHNALSNGTVDAIFDELPYIKLFLHKYGSKYMMVGPTYKTDGFGFAFPSGSPLVPYFSRAILNVTENVDLMKKIEDNNFGHGYSSPDYLPQISEDTSLGAYGFSGLFIITGFATIVALACSEISFGLRFLSMGMYHVKKLIPSLHILERRSDQSVQVHPTVEMSGIGKFQNDVDGSTASEGIEHDFQDDDNDNDDDNINNEVHTS